MIPIIESLAEVAVGVILGAGKGIRMRPLSHAVPKPLLPICNRPLIEHHIRLMKDCGITRIFVVVGHLGSQIQDELRDGGHLGVEIQYVTQPTTDGIAHALGLLRPYIDRTMVVFLGDIYFDAQDLTPAVAQVARGHVDGVLVSKVGCQPDEIRQNFAIVADQDGRVQRVIEKPQNPPNDIKGCGLYVFVPQIFDAIEKTPRSELRNEYEITDAIQVFINDGFAVSHAPLIRADINLTLPPDLLKANRLDLHKRGLPYLLGRDVRLPEQAAVDGSVLGDGVVVDRPIRIRNSIVLAGVHITADSDIHSSIICAEGIVKCHDDADTHRFSS